MDNVSRSVFLDFVTSCPRLPPGTYFLKKKFKVIYFSGGVKHLSIDVFSDPHGGYPRSRACVNHLYLPKYTKPEVWNFNIFPYLMINNQNLNLSDSKFWILIASRVNCFSLIFYLPFFRSCVRGCRWLCTVRVGTTSFSTVRAVCDSSGVLFSKFSQQIDFRHNDFTRPISMSFCT